MALPPQTQQAEDELLSWIHGKAGLGVTILQKEIAYRDFDNAVKFVNGEQYPLRSKAISKITDNRLRKIAQETVSTLTDVRPIWNYESLNPEFKKQSTILNKLARGWWKNSAADRKLQSVLMWSCVGGTGYAYLTWNSKAPGGGEIELIPYAARDVIPIDPVYTDSIQDWRGVILKQRLPIETVRDMFPSKAYKITGQRGSWFGPPMREQQGLYNVQTTMWNILSRGSERPTSDLQGVDLMRVFVKDDTLNLSDAPITMGDPNTNWSYVVPPLGSTKPNGELVGKDEARLYPRGRLIICTPEAILRDIPNPFWHGFFPIIKFCLDPLPWSLLGASMIGDLIHLQNALNESLRGAEDGLGQWIRRGIIADRRSISRSALDELDTRKSGLRAYLNPSQGEGFKIVDGPNPGAFDIYLKLIDFLKTEMDDLSGMRGIQALAQMSQLPAEGTMEKFMDALSPILRLRSRSIEVSLGELAEMIKVNFFQYYDTPRRMQILGKDGVSLEDFDYDPGHLIPDKVAGTPDDSSTMDRAQRHHRNFSFNVAPNSFLNASHATQKMFMLQLLRANLMDPWTVWDNFDVVDVGPPPAETVVERIIAAKKIGLMQGPTPEMVQGQQALMMAQLQMQLAQLQQQQFVNGPVGQGAPPGGPQGNPTRGIGPGGGRPPSGAVPPHMEMKDGGTRPIVSESQ